MPDPIPYLTNDQELTSIADAIRTRGGTSATLEYPTEFVSAIEAIPSGGDVNVETSKSYTVSASGAQTISPSMGYDAMAAVALSVSAGSAGTPSATKDIYVEDDTNIITAYITPSVTNTTGWITGGTKTGTAVMVEASELVSGTYIVDSSGTKDVTNYENVSVPSGSATTPATSITANPSISVNSSTGLITATSSASQSVTPTVSAGYVSSGTAGTISVSGSNTEQLTIQAAQTIHPSTTDQTIASGKFLTGTQTIKGVTISGLSADNIVSGVTVKIGDSTDDDCVASVTGTASSYIDGDSVGWGTPIYTVTISLTNAQGTGQFGRVEIACDYGTATGRILDTITTPNGSTTVAVPTDASNLAVYFNGNWVGDAPEYATTTCTGGVAYDYYEGATLVFSVTGDGTITVDGVDWEFDY